MSLGYRWVSVQRQVITMIQCIIIIFATAAAKHCHSAVLTYAADLLGSKKLDVWKKKNIIEPRCLFTFNALRITL